MKKFIPYIFITAFIGAFLMISFSPSFSGTFSEQNIASAQKVAQEKKSWGHWFYDSALDAVITEGKYIYETRGAGLIPGQAIVDYYWGDWGKIADATIGQMVSWISDFTWHVSAKLFTLSGYLLDYAVDFSVKDFKKNIENIGIVTQGYKIILNVANMIFIFLILQIAIKTILGLGGDTKKLLTMIIVVGLMINFSLFMTRVIIDATNIVAMGFYNAIQTEVGKTKIEGDDEQKKMISVGSVSTAMMAGMRLQTLIPSPDSEYNKKSPSKGLTNFNIALNQFGGSALFLVSAFVFMSVAILFIIRFITLLFYMMFSPVAFLGYISPELKEYSSKWWGGLKSQAIFAPAFLFIAYLISSIVNGDILWKAVGGDSNSSANFYDVISSPNPQGFAIVLNYVILIALMIGGLITAKSMAAVGSHGATKYAQKFQGWAQGMMGRNTIGRAAYLAGNNRYMGKIMKKMPTLGTFAKTQFDNVAGQKFGSKIGYEAALKKSIDKKKKMAEFVAKSDLKETSESLRKEERRLDEKNEFRIEQMKKTNEARKEVERLKHINADMKAFGSWTKADTKADIDASKILAREESLLENAERDMTKINTNIDILKKFTQKNISNIANREYAKNIEFGSSILNKLFPSGADAAAEIRKGQKTPKQLFEEAVKAAGGISDKKEEGAEEKKEEKKA